MSYQYTSPYNQNTSGYGQSDMNKVQGNAGYMNGMPAAANQVQTNTKMSTPMAGMMPPARQMPASPAMPGAAAGMMPPARQMPASPVMPGAAPMGTTPLARQLPIAPAPPIATPAVPPGAFTGRSPSPIPAETPLAASMPQTPTGPETPVTVASPYYTAGFLRNFVGKNVRVEFLLGTTGTLSDRIGTLLEVGASYIVLQPLLTDDLLMCDLYSIRFVTIIY